MMIQQQGPASDTMRRIQHTRHLLAKQENELAALDHDIRERETALKAAFDYGGAGKNNSERDLALAGHLADDEMLARWRLMRLKLAFAMNLAKADLEAALDERRFHEWSIRAALAEALAGRAILTNHRAPGHSNAPAGDMAFDDVADEEIVTRLYGPDADPSPAAPPEDTFSRARGVLRQQAEAAQWLEEDYEGEIPF